AGRRGARPAPPGQARASWRARAARPQAARRAAARAGAGGAERCRAGPGRASAAAAALEAGRGRAVRGAAAGRGSRSGRARGAGVREASDDHAVDRGAPARSGPAGGGRRRAGGGARAGGDKAAGGSQPARSGGTGGRPGKRGEKERGEERDGRGWHRAATLDPDRADPALRRGVVTGFAQGRCKPGRTWRRRPRAASRLAGAGVDPLPYNVAPKKGAYSSERPGGPELAETLLYSRLAATPVSSATTAAAG